MRSDPTSSAFSRRDFVVVSGSALLAACVDSPLSPSPGSTRALPLTALATAGVVYDPVPNPIEAGWVKEGSELFTNGTPLLIADGQTGGGAYCSFYCPADSLFEGEISLGLVKVSLLQGFITDTDGNTGVFVTINEGQRQIRAVLFSIGGVQSIKVETIGGFSAGIPLAGAQAQFTIKRLTDGSALLSMDGREEPTPWVQLALSDRPGVKTLEFGTYNVNAACNASFETLGLPTFSPDAPFAGFTVREFLIRDSSCPNGFFCRADFTPAAGETIDALTQPVSLTLTRQAAPTSFWRGNALMPLTQFNSFTLLGRQRLFLAAAERTRTSIEALIISAYSSMSVLDLNAGLPGGNYSQVTVEFRIGTNVGRQTIHLVERRAGSGRWRMG